MRCILVFFFVFFFVCLCVFFFFRRCSQAVAGQRATVPIMVHGDDGGVAKTNKVFVLSWASCLPRGQTQDTYMYFSALPYAKIIDGRKAVPYTQPTRPTHLSGVAVVIISIYI